MDTQTLTLALNLVSKCPELIQRLGMLPNIKTATLGGNTWWNDIAQCNGWRVQRNTWTGHCRILDSDDVRQAWGSEQAVMAFFQKVLNGRRP